MQNYEAEVAKVWAVRQLKYPKANYFSNNCNYFMLNKLETKILLTQMGSVTLNKYFKYIYYAIIEWIFKYKPRFSS
jgi:hypothetical protein